MTTASCCVNLKRMGHDVAIFCFYGLEGSKAEWGDIPLYPNNPRDWGLKHARLWFDHFKADIFVTLVDMFVLGGMDKTIPWVAFCPIDSDPVSPHIIDVINNSPGLIKILSESKYGQATLAKEGIESAYVSHATDCGLFTPRDDWRKISRERYKWEDKFVIGTVGTNHNERKNWTVAFKAFKIFSQRHPGEIIWYLHTNPVDTRGINLIGLRRTLKLEDSTFFPSTSELEAGIARDVMARAYNSFDVFLLPSKGEGFGVPLIEAQACGVPIITTKCTAQQELMGGGWFIEDLIPEWTQGGTWHFGCHPEEVAECLEKAYQAKKDGSIEKERVKARLKALEYDEPIVFAKYWPPVLEELEQKIKHPERFRRQYSYKDYYKRRAILTDIEEKIWWDSPDSPMSKVVIWHEEKRTDICLRMLGDICKGKRVLAVGSGRQEEGRFLSLIDTQEIVRTDLIADQENNIAEADVEDLPFKKRSFDVVICRELIEHVIDEKKALREISRVLKNKGYLLITTPNKFELGVGMIEHVRAFSPKEFIKFIENAGFKIIDKRGNVPHIFKKPNSGLFNDPEFLPEFQELSKGFDENPLSYFVSTQLFVLAQKKK